MSLRAGALTGLMNQPSAQVIDGSLKFDRTAFNYLDRTFSAGNRRTFTFSFWVKASDHSEGASIGTGGGNIFSAGTVGAGARTQLGFGGPTNGSNEDKFQVGFNASGSSWKSLTSDAFFRDFSSWQHVVCVVDVTQSTDSDRVKFYSNGKQFSLSGTFPSDEDQPINSAVGHAIGRYNPESADYFNGLISNFYFIDGLALGPEYFGFTDPLTNTWRPKKFKAEGTTFNDGTVWSSGSTVTGGTLSGATYGFDGSLSASNYCNLQATTTSTTANVTFAVDFKNVTKVEVFVHSSSSSGDTRGTCETIGGETFTSATLTNASQAFHTIYEGEPIRLKNIGWGVNQNGQTGTTSDGFRAFRINGEILIDSTTRNLDFGTNGFYLPMDGNSPIGQDRSGKGNNFQAGNFGGSNSVDKATGALPILNVSGGNYATVGVRTDAYANDLVLALPLVGSSDDVSNQINSGSTTKTITANGNAAASSAESNFYNGSFEFDGSGDYIVVTNTSDLVFEEGTFTIECWMYAQTYNSVTYPTVISKYDDGDASWILRLKSDGDIIWYAGQVGGGTNNESTTQPINLNQWHHLAVVREGTGSNQTKVYVDGILQLTCTDSSDYDDTNNIYIGRQDSSNANEFDGYIQDVRIYKGATKYTSDFIPASPSPNILPDTPSGVSGGSKLTRIIDGAVAFDGSGDYLNISKSGFTNIASDDAFTIESFVYFNDLDNYSTIFASSEDSFTTGGFKLEIYNSKLRVQGNSFEHADGSTTLSTGRWHHFAFSRTSGGNAYSFVDGVLVNSTTNGSATFEVTWPRDVGIGGKTDNTEYFNGFISNLRFVNGTALYTSAFTPPTEPLTNVTNTKLLCCQSNTSADAAAVQPSVTSYYTGGTALTWASYPIGSKWTLTNGNKNATSSGGSGYTGADVFSVALAANTTYAWTLDITNGDSTGGWYFADVQSNTGTHADQKEGNSSGLRGGETGLSAWGTFATANGYGDDPGQNKITMNSNVSPDGNKSIDFVVYRPASGTGKVWVKANTATTWIGGGNPSDTSSTATFIIPDGTTYFGFIDYDSGDTTNCNMRGDGDITSPPLIAHGNAAATNFNPFITDINTVRGQETGYATFNPLRYNGYTTSDRIFTDGNLRMLGRGDGVSNFGATTGKFYAEVFVERIKSGEDGQGYIGVIAEPGTYAERGWPTSKIAALRDSGGGGSNNFYGDGKGTTTTTWTEGDTISVAFDADAAKVWIAKNGHYINGGNPATADTPSFSGLTFKDYYFLVSDNKPSSSQTTDGNRYQINFGQKPFKYAPPDGFQPLNAANLRPETVILRPDQYVGIITATGTAGDRHFKTPGGFGPDLVWAKERNASTNHALFDSVRGATKRIVSNSTQVEDTQATQLKSFTSDGFIYGSDLPNNTGDTGVYWCWKAGGNKGTYNIDDVGYANASDVNMNTGSLTSSYYNTSHSISGNITTTDITFASGKELSKWFDGQRDTKMEPSASGTMDFTGISALQNFTGTLQFAVTAYSPDASMKFVVNGTHVFDSTMFPGDTGESDYFPAKTKWITIPVASLETVEFVSVSARSTQFWGMFLDGKQLVDSGVTPDSLPSIAPDSVSVGTKQGFSIIKYSGDSQGGDGRIPHGLTQEPDFMIFKSLDASDNWAIYHSSLGRKYLEFTVSSDAGGNAQNRWSSIPTDKVIYLGSDTNINTKNHVMYVWHNVPGLQKFGTYVGNGNGDGPFVELGFRPALVWCKSTSFTNDYTNWDINDSVRDTYNPADATLAANLSDEENSTDIGTQKIDFLSNGFKIRQEATSSSKNTNGETYLYAAWAEAPAFNLYGAQSNVR